MPTKKSAGKSADTDGLLLRKLNAAVAAANEAEKTVATAQTDLVSRSKVVEQLLLEAKKLHPKVVEFEAFLKRVNGLKLSRAYDLLRLAGGRATDEELRQETRDRVQKHRAKKKLPRPEPSPLPKPVSVTQPDVTETPEISAERRKAENTELDDPPLSDQAAKASTYALREFTVACRIWLPKVTTEADRQAARDLVATLTCPNCNKEAA
jgi:hypothetical protein